MVLALASNTQITTATGAEKWDTLVGLSCPGKPVGKAVPPLPQVWRPNAAHHA